MDRLFRAPGLRLPTVKERSLMSGRSLRWLGGLAVTSALAACGTPAYRYATDADDRVAFKVPASWQRINQDRLDALSADRGAEASRSRAPKPSFWQVAYDAAPMPSVLHLLTAAAESPVAYSRVFRVPEQSRSGVSLDSLRDTLLPLSAAGQAQAAASGVAVPVLEVQTDEVVSRKGLEGVHTVFTVVGRDGAETFDQTALKATDGSKVFVLLVGCAPACYQDRYRELQSVVRSFTVERP
ncbi:MAG: hypothetical protein NVSMB13_06810 [Mycobacteriales bacterium]